MTPTQREAAARLIGYSEQFCATSAEREAAALLRELVATDAENATVEPVAWWCKHPPEKGGGGFMTVDEAAAQHYMRKMAGAGVTLVPLYGQKAVDDLQFEADFYRRRCDALQAWQSRMRDPERTVVCDILANGFTLPLAFAGNRYGDQGPNVGAKQP